MTGEQDGGPAFPESIAIGPAGDVYPGMGGMSLRDYFAAQAIVVCAGNWPNNPQTASKNAYAHADAMLALRGTRGDT